MTFSCRIQVKKYSRELRKNMTDAERLLWSKLRGKQPKGLQIYRQRIIGNYIVPKLSDSNTLSFPDPRLRHSRACLIGESRRRPRESGELYTGNGFLFAQETLDSRFHGKPWILWSSQRMTLIG
ncbi:MAG: DUF559 domain-containing protein [Nitrospira sp.]|nr:DUF559 domain-containing protein [Nitrospira sp.]